MPGVCTYNPVLLGLQGTLVVPVVVHVVADPQGKFPVVRNHLSWAVIFPFSSPIGSREASIALFVRVNPYLKFAGAKHIAFSSKPKNLMI